MKSLSEEHIWAVIGFLIIVLVGLIFLRTPPPSEAVDITPDPYPFVFEQIYVAPFNPSIYRFVDNEYGVVCWIPVNGGATGVDCLHLSETNHSQGR